MNGSYNALNRTEQNGIKQELSEKWPQEIKGRELGVLCPVNQYVRLYEGSERVREVLYKEELRCRQIHSSGAVSESRWTSWADRPNEPSGFRGRKEFLNRASALVTTCP